MRGAIPPLLQYAFMAWCLGRAQGKLHLPLPCPCLRISLIPTVCILKFNLFINCISSSWNKISLVFCRFISLISGNLPLVEWQATLHLNGYKFGYTSWEWNSGPHFVHLGSIN